MIAKHRGYTIEVRREECLGGWPMLYTTIIRDSDQYIAAEFPEDSGEKVRDQIRYMKERIDNELAEEDPWDEHRSNWTY